MLKIRVCTCTFQSQRGVDTRAYTEFFFLHTSSNVNSITVKRRNSRKKYSVLKVNAIILEVFKGKRATCLMPSYQITANNTAHGKFAWSADIALITIFLD